MMATLPAPFIERLEQIVPQERFESILRTFDAPKQVTFRLNTLKSTAAELEKALCNAEITFERVGWT